MANVRKHLAGNVTFLRWVQTRSHGWRIGFTCPSSRQNVSDHELWMNDDGAEATCTCLAYQTHGQCTLTVHAEEIVAAFYRGRAAEMDDATLARHDRKYARLRTLATADRLRFTAIGDEIAARWAGREAA